MFTAAAKRLLVSQNWKDKIREQKKTSIEASLMLVHAKGRRAPSMFMLILKNES
jgi:hypothetical protein